MRITDDSITFNALRLISENNIPWEMSEHNEDADHLRLIAMGYNSGVIDMATAMREVLKA